MIVRDWRTKVENRTARHEHWLEDENTEPVAHPPVASPAPPLDPFPHICAGHLCAICAWVSAHPHPR